MSIAPGSRRRVARATIRQRRARLTVLVVAVVVAVAGLISAIGGGSLPQPPAAGPAAGAAGGDPYGYVRGREADYVERAASGNAHVLFVDSPGGVMATAARVAAYRAAIDRATRGTGIDPNLLEGLVFVESAGRPQIIAGSDPADAAGLTQILASTGQSLLAMPIDLTRSRKLTREIDGVQAGTRTGLLAPLLARRAAIDPRFDPTKAIAATVRYVQLAERQFGRQDLAFESYHMGIGNLHNVLDAYDGGHPVPYAQLYFDSAPDHHPAAYRLLANFGDDSWLYYWRVLGAAQIMHLYRTDRSALQRMNALQNLDDAGAAVLHPPAQTASFADPGALASAYQRRQIVPLPTNAARLGLAFDPSMGQGAKAVGAPASLYRGLRPVALRLLIELAARVRTLSGGLSPLQVHATVSDALYQRRTGDTFAGARTGWGFEITRRYVRPAQAEALQAMLDRLQSLNLIAWSREGSVLDVTVADGGAQRAGHGL